MLTKTHIRDYKGQPLCDRRRRANTRSIGFDTAPFAVWRELKEEWKCANCYKRALRSGWFKDKADTTPTQSEGSLQNGNYVCKAYEG